MTQWKTSLLLKFVVLLLLVAFLTVFGLTSAGILYGYRTNLYGGSNTSYFASRICYENAREIAQFDILNPYIQEYFPVGVLEDLYRGNFTNVNYAIEEKQNGQWEVVSTTLSEEENYGFCDSFESWENGTSYRVTVAIKSSMPQESGKTYFQYMLFNTVHRLSDVLPWILVISFVLCVASFTVLCIMAGHRPGHNKIVLNWMDRLPLDAYALVAACLAGWLLWLSLENGFYDLDAFANTMACIGILTASLILLGWLLSLITRIKVGRWWENTLIYRLLHWIHRNGLHAAKMLLRTVGAIPIVWRTLVITGALLIALMYLAIYSIWNGSLLMLYTLISLAIVVFLCFCSIQLQKLKGAVETMANGDFDARVDTTGLYGEFRRYGEHLNAISDGMSIAIEQHTKSERMKTELITNVSHDIKTPLTSILNYVDLLQHTQNETERAQYLEVLHRQATRLKKLTEDLVEASKAATGNIQTELVPTDVLESLNQAVGEYTERLEAAGLTLVARFPDYGLCILADGRLLWRVLDNLLGNICKYAMPGTRVYLTVEEREKTVSIQLKNISRQQLNISPDELMERFVRGDSARSTEGSGLGLNIAKSLTELQHGRFRLELDGDLFKVDVELPKANG